MNLKHFILFITLLLIINGVSIYIMCSSDDDSSAIDTTIVNELVYESIDNWQALVSKTEELIENKHNFNYAIIDADEKLLVTTDKTMEYTIVSATKNRSTIRAIEVDGKIVGWLIIDNDIDKIISRNQRRISITFIISTVLVLAIMVIYYVYLNNQVVKPFNKMKKFAANVAQGNLDVPLDMDKRNVFGEFTESFDLMRDELAASRERERVANESKQELVAQLSHDIKTPVASIVAMTEVMQVTADDDKQRDKLAKITEKANQIDKLVTDLFNSTLEELDQLKVELTDVSSRDIAELLETSDFKKQIKDINIPECMVVADKLRLGQVFDNIIFNSYKYADTDIEVVSDITDGYLVVSISDFGQGVSEDELPLIMKKFNRGANAKGKSGSGLGLHISYQLIEKMGGCIRCYNKEKGFCVEIKINLS